MARREGQLRLNIICAHLTFDDFINIGLRDGPGVDVVAEPGDLPFEKRSVQEIFCALGLELFPQRELGRRLLPYWVSLLCPGGLFRAVAADGEAMVAGVASGSRRFENFRSALFGGQDEDGDFRFNIFTPDSLSGMLREAGLVDIATPVRGRVNGRRCEFEITARRPVTLPILPVGRITEPISRITGPIS